MTSKHKPEYLSKPTLFERFNAYKQSEDFKRDFASRKELDAVISKLFDEPASGDAEIAGEVLRNKFRWLENYDECEQLGHEFIEQTHDDGSSESVCWRCNEMTM
jgi:hypothetical protein